MSTPIHTQERRQLVEQMANDFSMDAARSIIRAMSEHTSMTCDRVADIMLDAWKRSKERSPKDVEQDMECFEKITMYP